jgi:hypothetical protein
LVAHRPVIFSQKKGPLPNLSNRAGQIRRASNTSPQFRISNASPLDFPDKTHKVPVNKGDFSSQARLRIRRLQV